MVILLLELPSPEYPISNPFLLWYLFLALAVTVPLLRQRILQEWPTYLIPSVCHPPFLHCFPRSMFPTDNRKQSSTLGDREVIAKTVYFLCLLIVHCLSVWSVCVCARARACARVCVYWRFALYKCFIMIIIVKKETCLFLLNALQSTAKGHIRAKHKAPKHTSTKLVHSPVHKRVNSKESRDKVVNNNCISI